ncbi:MAG: VOC family protein [Cellulosilyticum sp.]|nr:VOC family protein [Cellulosilyticum sp.]
MNTFINHVAVYVTDLEKSKEYYVKYFNGVSNDKYVNNKGFSSYFLSFSSGARLEIMTHTDLLVRDVQDKVNGWSHIAFSVGSKENVLKLTEQITSDGYELLSPPRETGDGYFESCVADPDGNRVEITS